jgi:hypothetical protein
MAATVIFKVGNRMLIGPKKVYQIERQTQKFSQLVPNNNRCAKLLNQTSALFSIQRSVQQPMHHDNYKIARNCQCN